MRYPKRYLKRYLPRGSRARDFTARVTSCKNATMQGEVRHILSHHSQSFRSILELLFLIHERLEEQGSPMEDLTMRFWSQPYPIFLEKGEYEMDEVQNEIKEELKVGGTEFVIRILFRQNASWQGEIRWMESNKKNEKKKYFRSLLEMIMLMQEAVELAGTPREEYTLRTWEDEEEEEVL